MALGLTSEPDFAWPIVMVFKDSRGQTQQPLQQHHQKHRQVSGANSLGLGEAIACAVQHEI